jgi:hypothetical protein
MKSFSAIVVALLFSSAAYAQQSVLSCEVKEVSGQGKTSAVNALRPGSVFDVPTDTLVERGATYEGKNLFNSTQGGETTTITINRETGNFSFNAFSGNFLTGGTGKTATGVCTVKKLKL